MLLKYHIIRKCIFFSLLLFTLTIPVKAVSNIKSQVKELIAEAGNADDDETRLEFLTKLSHLPGLEEQLKTDTDHLISEINRWLNGKSLSYFGITILKKGDYDFGIDKNSLLYPITNIYRARMLLWVTLEYGGYWREGKVRRKRLDLIRDIFEEAKKVFPENRLIRMYLGEPIPPQKQYLPAVGAPEWAIYQREGIERLADIIEWWIDNRLQENGEYGGDWDDDCEMWRWWVPVLIAFDDPKITEAQAIFSNGLLTQEKMKLGFTKHVYDVQHTAEPSADALTPMMHVDPDNQQWSQRALRLAGLMESFWTGKNERDFLQFKSTYFGVDSISLDPKKACDTVYHPRTVQPTLLYWQRTGDKRLEKLFTAWMDTWVDAAARAERGKPAGIIPSAIHWPDGKIGGLGKNWWKPENHQPHSSLYVWPSAMPMITNILLLTHYITRNPKYLEPIWSMAKIRLDYLQNPPEQSPAPGSKAWCGSKLGSISSVIAKYVLLDGATEFNQLIETDADPYISYRFSGEQQPLITALRNNAEALRINFAGYTSEVRYTDRVLRFPAIFCENGMYPLPIETIRQPNTGLLYSTLTGDPGNAGYFPINAVRWLTPPRDIAALMTETGRDRFRAELFHFGDKPRQMSAELYLLEPGEYTFTVYSEGINTDKEKTFKRITVSDKKTNVTFLLLPKKLCILEIRRVDRD